MYCREVNGWAAGNPGKCSLVQRRDGPGEDKGGDSTQDDASVDSAESSDWKCEWS